MRAELNIDVEGFWVQVFSNPSVRVLRGGLVWSMENTLQSDEEKLQGSGDCGVNGEFKKVSGGAASTQRTAHYIAHRSEFRETCAAVKPQWITIV